jgi:hypothetical protein
VSIAFLALHRSTSRRIGSFLLAFQAVFQLKVDRFTHAQQFIIAESLQPIQNCIHLLPPLLFELRFDIEKTLISTFMQHDVVHAIWSLDLISY